MFLCGRWCLYPIISCKRLNLLSARESISFVFFSWENKGTLSFACPEKLSTVLSDDCLIFCACANTQKIQADSMETKRIVDFGLKLKNKRKPLFYIGVNV